MSTALILGLASIAAIYNITSKLIALKEWDLKYGIHPTEGKRSDRWEER